MSLSSLEHQQQQMAASTSDRDSASKNVPNKADNKMGRWGSISYIVGNIVGAGIFVAPTAISNQVGSVNFNFAITIYFEGFETIWTSPF
jgi:hypothetical protein